MLEFYNQRRRAVRAAAPNAAHKALVDLERAYDVRIVTQNVDDLHERAGSVVDAHVHGSLLALRCFACGRAHDGPLDDYVDGVQRVEPIRCAACGNLLRPGVVWFGEALPEAAWAAAVSAAGRCALMLVVGTSGQVWPAAGLAGSARRAGAKVIVVNPEATALDDEADALLRGPSASVLPRLLDF